MSPGVADVLFAVVSAGSSPAEAAHGLGLAYFVEDDLGTDALADNNLLVVQRSDPELEAFHAWHAIVSIVSRRKGIALCARDRLTMVALLRERIPHKSISSVMKAVRKTAS